MNIILFLMPFMLICSMMFCCMLFVGEWVVLCLVILCCAFFAEMCVLYVLGVVALLVIDGAL